MHTRYARDGVISVFDVKTREYLRGVSSRGNSNGCELVSFGDALVSLYGGDIEKWPDDGRKETILRHGWNNVTCALVMNGSLYVARASGNIWRLDSALNIIGLLEHGSPIYCMINFRGSLCSGSSRDGIHLWNASDDCIAILTGNHDVVGCMTEHRGYLYSGSARVGIYMWDVDTRQRVDVLGMNCHRVVSLVSYCGYLISLTWGGNLQLWNDDNECVYMASTGEQRHSLKQFGGDLYLTGADEIQVWSKTSTGENPRLVVDVRQICRGVQSYRTM